jgi:multimeric flavodoxin WrbA
LTGSAALRNHRNMPTKKIVAFLGSPRPGGNTDTLAEAVLEGARSAGCATERFALRALHVHPCTGCGCCGRAGRLCIFRDDGEALYRAMICADVFLFVTPVYWYGPTALMKAFLDRLVVFNTPEARPLVRGKRAGLVAAWEEKGPRAAEPMVELFALGFRYLELKPAGTFLVDGAGPKDAVRGMGGVLERARTFGTTLA